MRRWRGSNCPPSWRELRELDANSARALEFCDLTAARTGEVIGARWDEIDLDNKLWAVPAQRMKNGTEHRVPLTDRASRSSPALPREEGNPHVFIGARPAGPGQHGDVQCLKGLDAC